MGAYTVDSSGTDCKSVVFGLGWCNSISSHHLYGEVRPMVGHKIVALRMRVQFPYFTPTPTEVFGSTVKEAST